MFVEGAISISGYAGGGLNAGLWGVACDEEGREGATVG